MKNLIITLGSLVLVGFVAAHNKEHEKTHMYTQTVSQKSVVENKIKVMPAPSSQQKETHVHEHHHHSHEDQTQQEQKQTHEHNHNSEDKVTIVPYEENTVLPNPEKKEQEVQTQEEEVIGLPMENVFGITPDVFTPVNPYDKDAVAAMDLSQTSDISIDNYQDDFFYTTELISQPAAVQPKKKLGAAKSLREALGF